MTMSLFYQCTVISVYLLLEIYLYQNDLANGKEKLQVLQKVETDHFISEQKNFI